MGLSKHCLEQRKPFGLKPPQTWRTQFHVQPLRPEDNLHWFSWPNRTFHCQELQVSDTLASPTFSLFFFFSFFFLPQTQPLLKRNEAQRTKSINTHTDLHTVTLKCHGNANVLRSSSRISFPVLCERMTKWETRLRRLSSWYDTGHLAYKARCQGDQKGHCRLQITLTPKTPFPLACH